MAYLEELRETAKAVGVDLKGETMDQIQLLREIAKALGVELDNSHKGVVELLSEINKVLPDALGGGGAALPYGQTNSNLYFGQLIEKGSTLEIDTEKLVTYVNAEGNSVLNSWPSSGSNYLTLVGINRLYDNSEGINFNGNLSIDIEVHSSYITFDIYGSNELEIPKGNYSTPAEALIANGKIILDIEYESGSDIVQLEGIVVEALGIDVYYDNNNLVVENTNDFLKVNVA